MCPHHSLHISPRGPQGNSLHLLPACHFLQDRGHFDTTEHGQPETPNKAAWAGLYPAGADRVPFQETAAHTQRLWGALCPWQHLLPWK